MKSSLGCGVDILECRPLCMVFDDFLGENSWICFVLIKIVVYKCINFDGFPLV